MNPLDILAEGMFLLGVHYGFQESGKIMTAEDREKAIAWWAEGTRDEAEKMEDRSVRKR